MVMKDATTVDARALDALIEEARRSPRHRMNRNLHSLDDAIHRLLNATEPETYVRPHRHLSPPRLETLSVLRGRGCVITFTDRGAVTGIHMLSPWGPTSVLEIEPTCFHTLVAVETATVWLEVKAGPYEPPTADDTASWAPDPADTDAAREYLGRMRALALALGPPAAEGDARH